MNASDAMRELIKYNAVADKEWHGEKLDLKTNEQRAEEAWAAGGMEQGADGQETDVVKNGRFEIEINDSKSKVPSSPNSSDTAAFDNLQRQRSLPKAVVWHMIFQLCSSNLFPLSFCSDLFIMTVFLRNLC